MQARLYFVGFKLVQDAVIFCSARNRFRFIKSVGGFLVGLLSWYRSMRTCWRQAEYLRASLALIWAYDAKDRSIHSLVVLRQTILIRSGFQNKPNPAVLPYELTVSPFEITAARCDEHTWRNQNNMRRIGKGIFARIFSACIL